MRGWRTRAVRPRTLQPAAQQAAHLLAQGLPQDLSVTTGTCMHATKHPVKLDSAIYLVMTARKGVSAMQLSKELGGGDVCHRQGHV